MDSIPIVTSPQADQKERQKEEDLSVSEQKGTVVGLDNNLSGQEKIASNQKDVEANEVVFLEQKHVQHDINMHHPRLVYFEPNDPPLVNTDRVLEDDPMLHAPPGFEAVPQDRLKTDYTDGDCVPMHKWQTKSFPNCNLLHEYDLRAAGPNVYYNHNNTNLILDEDNLVMLGQGWFRHTWRLDIGSTNENVVIKTLRLEREFYDEFYDLHRRDAVAMERLTHSPFIMNIYGYCGQSALNELADFGDGNLASLEKVNRQMRGSHDPDSFLLKLQLATSVAVGVAHIHELDGDDDDDNEDEDDGKWRRRPSLVHYDLNPRNVAIVRNGKPKINDFNIAEFLHWNPKTNETCGFSSRLHEPWWRAPEEVAVDLNDSKEDRPLLDEKVDVYALGSIIFHVLTTHSPRGKMKKERIEEVREIVARGIPPFLEEYYVKSKDPAVKAIRRALDRCFEPDPKNRGSAREVADLLLEALTDIKAKRKEKDAKKKRKHS
jgi:serine/threonine protein kinase